jgi:Bacterial transcriptional activator domain
MVMTVDATPPTRRSDPARGSVTVEILGPVRIVGAARAMQRAWTLELVAYLALHPHGATSDEWATALWPDRLMAPPTRHSIASAARRALGCAPGGDDHLPRRRGALQLGPGVTSDWCRLQELARSSDPRDWSAGLRLVRGRPFGGLRDSDWCVLEGHVAEIEETVGSLAERLGRHALVTGDPLVATWSARQGLRIAPYDERLYRVLLEAADRQGNPGGVETLMAELLTVLDAPRSCFGEPESVVHPRTAALYRQLRGGHRATWMTDVRGRGALVGTY